MTVKIKPPFDVTPRVDARTVNRPRDAQLEQLRAIVRGQEGGFSRAGAMALLAETDYPNVHRDLAAVLLDESELSRIRTAAAMTLWRLRSAEAAGVLERSLAVKDERVLARGLHRARSDRPERRRWRNHRGAPTRRGLRARAGRLRGHVDRASLRAARAHGRAARVERRSWRPQRARAAPSASAGPTPPKPSSASARSPASRSASTSRSATPFGCGATATTGCCC